MHWSKQETEEQSAKNSQNRLTDRGGLGVYVHNLGACSMSSKDDQVIVSFIYFFFFFIYIYILIIFLLGCGK